MFACRFPKMLRVTDYQSALALWDKSPKKKGYSDPDWRDPFGRPRDNTVVYKASNGDIRFRLYSTDVVTVHPDDTVTLEPVSTPSTNNFVWAVLGGPLRTHWTDRAYPCPDMITEVGGKLYNTPGFAHVRFDKDTQQWQMLGGDKPIDVPILDRSAARKLLKTSGFKTFELWLKTQLKLGIDPRQGDRWSARSHHTSNAVLRCLDEPDRYGDIARGISAYMPVSDQLSQMRLALYKYDGLADTTEVPYFNDWSEMTAAFAKMRKYA